MLVIVAIPRAAALLDDPAAGAVLTAALLLAAVALRRYVPERRTRRTRDRGPATSCRSRPRAWSRAISI